MIQTRHSEFGLVTLLCVAMGTSACTPANGEGDRSNANSAAAEATSADLDSTDCGTGARMTKIDYGVNGDDLTPLRVQPDANAAVVQEQIGNTEMPVFIDSSVDVRELCRAKNWSKVRIPSAKSSSSAVLGWLPSSVLAKVKTDVNGRRIYSIADFDWKSVDLPWAKGSSGSRAAVVTVINRIMKDNPHCGAIDRQSLVMNRVGGAAKFTVACALGDDQSFEFTAADASNGRSFAPEPPMEPIAKADAREACRRAVLNAANHPSTIEFAYMSENFDTFGNGAARFATDVSGKNSFNLGSGPIKGIPMGAAI